MATPVLKSFAKQSGKSLKDVEKAWETAKKEAEKMGQKDNYAYITGIVKNMIGLSESKTEEYTLLARNFVKSDKLTLSEFEAEIEEEGTISTEIKDVPETFVKGRIKKNKKKSE